jgi:hypothetical protein
MPHVHERLRTHKRPHCTVLSNATINTITDHPPGAAFSDWIYFTQKELDFTSSTNTAAASTTGTHSRRA